MILQKYYDSLAFSSVQAGLGAAHLRHAAVSDNMANVNTPFYKRKRVSFETELRRAVQLQDRHTLKGFHTHPEHIPINGRVHWTEVRPEVYREQYSTWRNDGNNVDIDLEMAEEAKNTVQYLALANIMKGNLQGLKETIKNSAR